MSVWSSVTAAVLSILALASCTDPPTEMDGGPECPDGQRICAGCGGGESCISVELPCPEPCVTCATLLDCYAEDYCQYEPYTCGGIGRCEPRPIECPEDCPGACGCGLTVLCNECLLAQAGISVADPSSCGGEPCGETICESGSTCCPVCDGQFMCTPPGMPCPVVECPDRCGSDSDCEPDHLCVFEPWLCGGRGHCLPRPASCDDSCPGVCGCDGAAYCNDCEVLMAGTSRADDTRCERPCGRGGRSCTADEYCELGPECAALEGTECRPRPTSCTDEEDLVCGCDGRVYANPCNANFQGTSIRAHGRCGAP